MRVRSVRGVKAEGWVRGFKRKSPDDEARGFVGKRDGWSKWALR